ncbi:MAG TPA: heme biosynthesis HemY N-terminal domain-containing protein [Bauldia sp.]|nr:heme biosynthesis HemY N-terminal domain-containing protein [Bauldia sp.]
MLRLLVVVALIFIAAAGFVWLADRPGGLVLLWQGQEIRTSLMVAVLAVVLLVLAIGLIGALVRWIVSRPQSVGHFLGARRRDRGYRALTRGMIAVGAGDVRAARRAAQESQSLLGKEPLVLLLSAQAAQIAGDAPAARSAFEALSAEHDTRILGLHGLFVEARRQGEHAAARAFAEEATRIQPKIAWAGTALFEYQSRAGDWQGALATLTANTDAKLIDKEKARRYRAVLDTARAMELEAGEPDEARALALEAHKLALELVPAATTAARLFARAGDYRRATRILEATWKASPNPEIAEAYGAVRPGDSVRDRLKRVQRLADLRANNPEGAMAVARAAIDAHEWQEARTALGGMMRANPTERVCLLMAEIEAGETGDQGRVRQWLTRALSAPRDPAWIADGQVYERWEPVSPISGQLDAFEWKVPADRLPVRATFEIEAPDNASDAASPAIELGTTAQPATAPAISEPVLRQVPAGELVPAGPPPKGARPMARAPDDPGPGLENEQDDGPALPLFHRGHTA